MLLQQKTLIKICLIGFLLSFIIIYDFEEQFEIPISTIESLTLDNIGDNIRIKGEIVKERISNDNSFFLIKDKNNSTITGIAFDFNETIEKNEYFDIVGKISYYDEKLELVVKSINKK